ncbi:hypothetical protein V6N12_005144 [Hibiscus sabdariffa]|uniref:Uncharacterized protein n=1 Tax=Hibiscus sabdariffa TaxID=183260 RepID=A0ABR2CNK5_9ROSI
MGNNRRLLSSVLLLFVALAAAGPSGATASHTWMPFNRSCFPQGFVFGAGSAAYQIEGAALEDGKGPSFWDNYVRKYPEGKLSGGVNPLGVQFYNNVIDHLLANGLKPFVTLLHFDHPQALEDEYGGFSSPEIVADFVDYADLCFKTFGDRVKHWVTMNEPNGWSMGIANGFSTPASQSYVLAHHFLLSHAAAVKLYRDKYQVSQRGEIGITLVTFWYVPKYDTTEDREAANRVREFTFGCDARTNLTTEKNGVPIGTPTQVSWLFIYPKGLRDLMLYIKKKYNNPPIYITENGVAEANNASLTIKEALKDGTRIKYLDVHLKSLLRAIREGVNIKGYYMWSFLDDFEWTSGIRKLNLFSKILNRKHLLRFRDGIEADLEGIEGFAEGSSYILQRWPCC